MNVPPLRRSRAPPLLSVTGPAIDPGLEKPTAVGRPLRVPPVLTVTVPVPVPLPLLLLIWRIPPLIVVPPV